jgi:SAM-dependent methyltransferase
VAQTWHYGLVARWWAEFNTDGPEIEYFRRFVERFGEPVLDAACGSGRLLVPFRASGLDVDGVDISPDMIAAARRRLAAEGLARRAGETEGDDGLYVAALHQLDLQRRYRTIVLCGGFGLGGSLEHDREALRRSREHLLPGGALAFDYYLPYKDAAEWSYWPAEERRRLPAPWPEEGMRKRASDGDEIELLIRLAALDPLEQVATRELRARLWRDGRVVEEERHVLLERLYLRNEVLAMLEAAGFGAVEVLGDHTLEAATAESGVLVFVARP